MKKTIMLFLMFFLSLIVDAVTKTSAQGGTISGDNFIINLKELKEKKKMSDSIALMKSAFAALEQIKVEEKIETEILYRHVKGTVYHADPNQTDDTPFITADNSVIDNSVVNDLKWVALSRDLLKRTFTDPHRRRHVWTGKIKLGDTIWVDYDKKSLWKTSHPQFKHLNRKHDSLIYAKQDTAYKKLLKKFEQIKGYWIVHDIMGDRYPLMKKNGQYIRDAKGNKQYARIYSAIDFLQHPEIGMMDAWDRHIILAKRKVSYITSTDNLLASN